MTRPWRPSNGTEGAMFEERWCVRCKHDAEWWERMENPCEIHNAALAFQIGDPRYPKEWVCDDDGSNPRCLAFEEDK